MDYNAFKKMVLAEVNKRLEMNMGTEKMYDKAYMITCRMNICESLLQKSADMDLEI